MGELIKIALIGANEQQNPLILKAKELNFETHVFARQTVNEIGAKTADHFYPISASNKEEILSKCKELGVQGIASIGSDVASRSCAYVAEQLGFPTSSYDSLLKITNKIVFRNTLREHRIPQPQFLEISDSFDAVALKNLSFPLVVKPSDRSGGRGLSIAENEKQLFKCINTARDISFEGKAIVEKYIAGQCYSCECISFNGKHTVLSFTRRSVFEDGGSFTEVAHAQPSGLALSVREKIEREIAAILDLFSIKYGASSVEFIVDENKNHYYVEITPTMYGDFIGSHLVESSIGYDYLGAVLMTAMGKEPAKPCGSPIANAEIVFICDKNSLSNIKCTSSDSTVIPLTEIDEAEIPEKFDSSRHGCYLVICEKKAFGGCIPIELPAPVKAEHRFTRENSIALNSEFTALTVLLQHKEIKRLFLPYYISSSWEKSIERCAAAEILRYHIDCDLSPCMDELKDLAPDDAVMLVDHFGVCTDKISKHIQILKELYGTSPYIIVNSSAAYFAPITIDDKVYQIYSCRKFFGVPDGAYLVGNDVLNFDVSQIAREVSYTSASANLVALELGEMSAYKSMQTNEQELVKNKTLMSALSEKIMSTVRLEEVKEARMNNFLELHSVLSAYQKNCLFSEELMVSPQCYPLMVDRDIRSELKSEKIFAPQLWRKFLDNEYEGTAERYFTDHLLCLPIDQRYSTKDMQQMADIIKGLLT